jgi:hypothetical protein
MWSEFLAVSDETRSFAESLIDAEEDPALRAVLVGSRSD